MLTKRQTRNLLFVFFFMSAGVCQGREIKPAESPVFQDAAPVVKYREYGFDILDIVRSAAEKIDVEFSATFNSKFIWNGIDAIDDHGVFIPVLTVIFGDSGFSGKIMDAYPLSSGFQKSVQRNYAAFYTGKLFEDKPYATNYTLNYWYYAKPNVAGGRDDSQELGSTFFWPELVAVGDGSITPSYYIGVIWGSRSDTHLKECEGVIHIFGANYDFAIPNFWPDGTEQGFRVHGDITYNDGFAGKTIEHEWSHATLAVSTNITKGNLTITPVVNYQISMEDSVNPEDEFWCGITATYRF